MPRKFSVPPFYRSRGISLLKEHRLQLDPRRRDLSPTVVDFGRVRFKLARHFGFCFGVENAIEIAYRALEEHPGKRIFLLSEMIHNAEVNTDLRERGVEFLMDTDGTRRVPFSVLQSGDIVIVPAFGTTVELQEELAAHGVDPYYYDTTCPFVEKVWRRSAELGRSGFTVIVHGKRTHEETRATFSHSKEQAPTLVIRDMGDAQFLVRYLAGEESDESFAEWFRGSASAGFDPRRDLTRIGVVNQTTMLASETQAIANVIREAFVRKYGEAISEHFADTRDTLCYATYENQSATEALIRSGADLAIVVGGYNSSNTSHLVELCEEVMPTFYIQNADAIHSSDEIEHYHLGTRSLRRSHQWFPENPLVEVALTSGASCPDATVDSVIRRVVSLLGCQVTLEEAVQKYVEVSAVDNV